MPDLYYDMHLHSCLSPCANDDMTPANIVAMADLIGLDVIALTDHNTCKNCYAFLEAAKNYNLLAIPGMELCTLEDVHVLCLFDTLKKADTFSDFVSTKMIPALNRPDFFGNQIIYDANDEIRGEETQMLSSSTMISFFELPALLTQYGGVMIPAHIDKQSNALLANLGFIPPDATFTTAEIFTPSATETLIAGNPYLANCNILHNSDAHALEQIHERIHSISPKERTIESILQFMGESVHSHK